MHFVVILELLIPGARKQPLLHLLIFHQFLKLQLYRLRSVSLALLIHVAHKQLLVLAVILVQQILDVHRQLQGHRQLQHRLPGVIQVQVIHGALRLLQQHRHFDASQVQLILDVQRYLQRLLHFVVTQALQILDAQQPRDLRLLLLLLQGVILGQLIYDAQLPLAPQQLQLLCDAIQDPPIHAALQLLDLQHLLLLGVTQDQPIRGVQLYPPPQLLLDVTQVQQTHGVPLQPRKLLIYHLFSNHKPLLLQDASQVLLMLVVLLCKLPQNPTVTQAAVTRAVLSQ